MRDRLGFAVWSDLREGYVRHLEDGAAEVGKPELEGDIGPAPRGEFLRHVEAQRLLTACEFLRRIITPGDDESAVLSDHLEPEDRMLALRGKTYAAAEAHAISPLGEPDERAVEKNPPGEGEQHLDRSAAAPERRLADLHLRHQATRTALASMSGTKVFVYAVHAEVRRSDNGFRGWLAENREAASTGRRTH